MIKYPETFATMGPAGFDGTFNWDFLKPAFAPTKIEPMDLDCVIERRGNFLVFETKNGLVPLPQGQTITLNALVSTGIFTVIVLRAKTPEAIEFWDVWYWARKSREVRHVYESGTAQDLIEYVKRWFTMASQRPGRWHR